MRFVCGSPARPPGHSIFHKTMSFSSDVKNELCAVPTSACCEAQQARALLLFGRECSRLGLSLLTENGTVAKKYAEAVAHFSGHTPAVLRSDSGNYKISMEEPDVTDAVMDEILSTSLNEKKQRSIGTIDRECCRLSFVRGAFLSSGTVTNPDREYHMEFTCPTKHLAEELLSLLSSLEIEAKITRRNGNHVVYIKKSEVIEELLARLGAMENSLMLMGAKMYKDVRNTVNRRVNFENANIARSAAAAAKQTEAIEKIREKKGLAALPEDLRQIAEIRLENPESSTSEIVKLMEDAITVSGVNHRFKRILKIAEEL